MSRIGKIPVKLNDGVEFTQVGADIIIKGPKGELTFRIPKEIIIEKKEDTLVVSPRTQTLSARELYGTIRTVISNMVTGVSEGFKKQLEFKGTGYRVGIEDNNLILHMGYSHPVSLTIPEKIEVKVEKNKIIISGIDKQIIGQFAAKVRSVRGPEPYKGKGIRYSTETIRRKAGKAAGK